MTRCTEFYEKVERDGNFCNMDRIAYQRTIEYIAFCKEIEVQLGTLSERAARHVIKEKDSVVKAKAIESITKSIVYGRTKTEKQVKRLLKNIKAGKSNRGGDHKGADNVEDRREGFNNLLLTAVRSGEIQHHITDNVIIGIPEEVHRKLSGYSREEHREKVLKWLQEQANKYNIVLSFLENDKNITRRKKGR